MVDLSYTRGKLTKSEVYAIAWLVERGFDVDLLKQERRTALLGVCCEGKFKAFEVPRQSEIPLEFFEEFEEYWEMDDMKQAN